MRAISLVQQIEFDFTGNVVRDALTLGDVDNDGCIELAVGSEKGEVAIFKGRSKIQTIANLSFVSCLAIGDILNHNRNSLVVVTADGWCYIYENPLKLDNSQDLGTEQVDGQIISSGSTEVPTDSNSSGTVEKGKNESELICIHKQRIPANAKNILLGDVDGDGFIEMVLGLTDRVVRSYKWEPNSHKPSSILTESNVPLEPLLGKLVALNKWECANQIGSITLHHAWDGRPSLLIAQPGGTFMRIKCHFDDSTVGLDSSQHSANSSQSDQIPNTVDYQFLGLSRMRNQNISTEILGDFQTGIQDNSCDRSSIGTDSSSKSGVKGRPYAVATLDGTIMLVQDEVILWAMAVDHQVFALTKLDVTGNGADDIVACSWDGQTYILDQEKNAVRFHLDEPVQAFTSGYYTVELDEAPVTALVYVTFKNKIIVYYDIPLKELSCKRFEAPTDLLSKLFIENGRTEEEAVNVVKKMDKRTIRELVEYILYNVKS